MAKKKEGTCQSTMLNAVKIKKYPDRFSNKEVTDAGCKTQTSMYLGGISYFETYWFQVEFREESHRLKDFIWLRNNIPH